MSELLDALELHPFRIPMRHRFRRVDHREGVLIRGPAGWGEFSPFPDYPPEVTTRWLAAALEAACSSLPEPGRSAIPVNVTVPAVAPAIARGLVLESGATTAKVKVGEPGQAPIEDEDRLDAVREALGPEGKIRVDVNAGWDLDTATERLATFSKFGLEYAEQPVATLEEMIELKKRSEVPLLRPDPLEVAASGAADLVVLKVQPLGGVTRALDIAARAGVPVVVSSALETSIGIYTGLLVASLLPDLPYACGLGTVALIEGDPTRDPLVSLDGLLEVRRPEPDPELLARWRPERDRAAEMLRKVRSAAEVLT
jgi:O-succinylbenzoate synthase